MKLIRINEKVAVHGIFLRENRVSDEIAAVTQQQNW